MASGYSDYNRIIREGPVKIIHENKAPEKYLKAVCGSSGDCSARLEVYEDYKSKRLLIRKILFIDVKNVGHTEDKQGAIITIKMRKDDEADEFFLFYADSQQSTMKWYRYCSLLFKIPKHDIPERNIALRQPEIDRYGEMHKCDIADKWVVNILSEGIKSRVTGLFQLSVISICHDTSTFNIYGFYTGKNTLTWQRDGIKRSGCIESLVFLEVDETCRGGPGLLWMECPIPQSMKLQKYIHEFLLAGKSDHTHEGQNCQKSPPSSPAGYVFVDSIMNIAQNKNDQELSQIPYDQSLDTLSLNPQISQNGTSLSSECSSGYCSDNSYVGGSISSKTSFTESDFKLLSSKDPEREQGVHENHKLKATLPQLQLMSTPTTAKTRNDKLICSSNRSLENGENGLTQKSESTSSTSGTKGVMQSKLKSSSGSSRSCNKETSSTRIPRPTSSRYTSNRPYNCHHMHSAAAVSPPTVQDDKCLYSKQKVSTDGTSKHRLEEIAFQKSSVAIVEKLDTTAMLPNLFSKGLLTPIDHQTLLSKSITATEKAQYLVEALPRKNQGSLEKFKECLRETQNGTGHGDILKDLSESYDNSQIDASKRSAAKKTHKCHHSMAKK